MKEQARITKDKQEKKMILEETGMIPGKKIKLLKTIFRDKTKIEVIS